MAENIFSYFNYTKMLVFITFAIVLAYHNPKKANHRLLLFIVFISFINELLSVFFLLKKIDIGLLYTINTILHNSLWLFFLSRYFNNPNLFKAIIVGYIIFSAINLTYFEGWEKFNFTTFILGAFTYLILFIYKSFIELKKENFGFFLSNDFILLFAPVLFFFGLSSIFGFKSKPLSSTIIFGDTNLYDFIGYFVNTIYYAFINLYIYSEKKAEKC